MMDRTLLDQLAKDPYKAHLAIRKAGGWPALLKWVKEMAVDHKLRLMVLPNVEYEARKWRILANILNGGIIKSDHDHPYDPKEIKGLWEVQTHFRSAHTIMRNGEEYVRSGTVVRIDKLNASDKKAFNKIIKIYNSDQRKKSTKGFIRIIDWLKEHPEALEIWNKQIEERR